MSEDQYVEQSPITAGAPPSTVASASRDPFADTTFSAVYDTYVPLLRKIAMRKFHIPRSEVDALIHDVFTTYLSHQERVREIRPYLVAGVCNAAKEYWRKSHRDRDLFCDTPGAALAADDHLLESVAQNLLIRSALARLGASCRETLRRFYVDGESATSIAVSRQTTQNSVLQLLHYCRKRARAAYLTLTGANLDPSDR